MQVHLWDNNEEIVEWLTKQLDETSRNNSIVQENIRCVQRDAVIRKVTAALSVRII